MNTICEFFLGERNIFILCITFFKHLGLVFDNQIETFDRYFIDGSILIFLFESICIF